MISFVLIYINYVVLFIVSMEKDGIILHLPIMIEECGQDKLYYERAWFILNNLNTIPDSEDEVKKGLLKLERTGRFFRLMRTLGCKYSSAIEEDVSECEKHLRKM